MFMHTARMGHIAALSETPQAVLFYVSNLETFRAQVVKEHAILF